MFKGLNLFIYFFLIYNNYYTSKKHKQKIPNMTEENISPDNENEEVCAITIKSIIDKSEEEKKEKIKELLNIKERISQLNKDEYYEIYKIIKKYDEPFSVNKNGVMFDLVKLRENTVTDISVFLKYLREKNNQIINDEFNRYKYKELLN